jgi:hypothetical protein
LFFTLFSQELPNLTKQYNQYNITYMTAITLTDILKSGILKKLARQGESFVIKIKGEADLLVTPQTAKNKPKKLIKFSQKLTIPDNYKTSETDFSNYDLDQPPAFRPVQDDEAYATVSPSFEQYLSTDSDQE